MKTSMGFPVAASKILFKKDKQRAQLKESPKSNKILQLPQKRVKESEYMMGLKMEEEGSLIGDLHLKSMLLLLLLSAIDNECI